MKTIITNCLLVAVFCAILYGTLHLISEASERRQQELRSLGPKIITTNYLYVHTDPETGVQYVSPSGQSGITPRLDANGKLVVVPVEKKSQ